jgi:hypothetical protein
VSAHHFPCFSKLFYLCHLLEKFYEFYVSVIVIRILFNLETEHISKTVAVKGKKVKFIPEQVTKAQRVSRGIALPFL